ncbi:GNAT family N-acetyltransferase [Mycobacterium sp. D16R24]|uniref:GNAT family N-acetyltransferase n=1 Tax=Mycobacterium sp. D16R24 TaxID=1855656 RepID=UPI000992B000|nr:GNAT family N-acetyltransferase [Mycobacterium sp. D16R24]
MNVGWSRSADLDTTTLYGLLRLRAEAFIVGQNCAYQDLDGRDLEPETRHFWIKNENGDVVSGLRVLADPQGAGFWIGRVCTAADERGRGHAARLVRAVLAEIGGAHCRLNAQAHLRDMYGKLGFVVSGDDFLEDGIPHVPMTWMAGND